MKSLNLYIYNKIGVKFILIFYLIALHADSLLGGIVV